MYWLLVGTLCLLTHANDPSTLKCTRVISEIEFSSYETCNTFSYQVVDEFGEMIQKHPGQSIQFFCVPYYPLKLKGTET